MSPAPRLARRLGLSSLAAAVALAAGGAVRAGQADVLEVHATCTTIRTCDFQVTVRHADVGWSHYADRFEVVSPGGEVLGTRVLRHPHVHEQPFVRGLVGVEIPDGVDEVVVRAGDNVHGLGGRTVTLRLSFPERGHEAAPPAADPAPPPSPGPAPPG